MEEVWIVYALDQLAETKATLLLGIYFGCQLETRGQIAVGEEGVRRESVEQVATGQEMVREGLVEV